MTSKIDSSECECECECECKMTGEEQWSSMPHDLLSQIANGLGLIDFLSFRGVCKDWRAASSKVSAQGKSLGCDPWFLVYGGEGSQCSLISHEDTRYTINIPELDGATCLASHEGWLFLFAHASLFFFSPFSRAKIELPNCPFTEVSDHVAAFSSAPTSQHCIVTVAKRIGEHEVELFIFYRGENEWVKHHFLCPSKCSAIRTAWIYKGKEFQSLDVENGLVTFNFNSNQWNQYRIRSVPIKEVGGDHRALPYRIRKDHFQLQYKKRNLDFLEPNSSISTLGTVIPQVNDEFDIIIKSESIDAATPSESRHLKGVWIQPIYLYVPPDQRSW